MVVCKAEASVAKQAGALAASLLVAGVSSQAGWRGAVLPDQHWRATRPDPPRSRRR